MYDFQNKLRFVKQNGYSFSVSHGEPFGKKQFPLLFCRDTIWPDGSHAAQESLIKMGILKKLAGFFCKIFPQLVAAAELYQIAKTLKPVLKHRRHSALLRLSCFNNFGSTFTFPASHHALLSTSALFSHFLRQCFKLICQFWWGIDQESIPELLLIPLDSRQVLVSADAFTHGCPLSQFLVTWCLPAFLFCTSQSRFLLLARCMVIYGGIRWYIVVIWLRLQNYLPWFSPLLSYGNCFPSSIFQSMATRLLSGPIFWIWYRLAREKHTGGLSPEETFLYFEVKEAVKWR